LITYLGFCKKGDFGVLSPENRMALLKKKYRGLKHGGLFVMDVFTPNLCPYAAGS